ncbi:MAG: L,D-transpeptidase family protein [Pseudomonadota bacterium]|nr:L,D-transpeptidase family protein [Pseudomonadota bacterium]
MFAAPCPTASLPRRQWLALMAASGAMALPAATWAQQRRARQTANYPIAPGKSFWLPDVVPAAGPVVAMVNLHTQHVQVYRNGVAVGYSSVSTGKPGHGTPTGLFTVLEKRRHHRSNLYNNAPMPWMVRLTWGGIAFHGGALPGYPASHGCIRLPMDFAPRLFGALKRGDTVAVLRQAPTDVHRPLTLLAPIDTQGAPLLLPEMVATRPWWAPAAPSPASIPASAPVAAPAPAAPLSLLASWSQRRLFVLREGQVLAAAALPASATAQALGGQSVFSWTPDGAWHAPGPHGMQADAALWRQVLPTAGDFAERLRTQLTPGSTLLASALPAVSNVHAAVWSLKR